MPKSAFSANYKRLRMMLRAARKHAGLSQADVAQQLGKPQSFVSKYERGERRLDVIEFLEIAKIVGLNVRDLNTLLRE